MMKTWMKWLIISLLMIVVCCCAAAMAESRGTCGAQGNNLTWTLDSEGTLTISGTGAMADYSSSDVTTAPWPKTIKQAVILEGVTSIGNRAFFGCSSLAGVTIQEGVTGIGEEAFFCCTSLTSIAIPSSVSSIGDYAFYNCTSLTGITIPEGVTRIGSCVFSWCTNLTSITIPDGVTRIGDLAFDNCRSLTSITIPDGVTSIDIRAFNVCDAIRYANLDSDGAKALSKAKYSFRVPGANYNLKYLYTNGSITGLEISNVDWNATSINFPDGVTSIGSSAFYGCSSLTSVTIPSSVTGIGSSAFSGCTSLTSIAIPSSVTSIGAYAFVRCSSLTSVAIPEGVTSIGEYAFGRCSSLTSVAIPEGVTSIGEYAFFICSSLTSVAIPSSVTSIGNAAFSECTGMTSITIPDGVTSIGDGAFIDCSSLANVYYFGTAAGRARMTVGSNNDPLNNATWHYAYTVTMDGSIQHGAVAAGSAAAFENETVTLTATPDAGYILESLTVLQGDAPVAVANGQFTMPAGDVTVSAVFVPCGTCGANGDNLTWVLHSDGTLTIRGTGAMADFSASDTPWPKTIKQVVIHEGVTHVGNYSFYRCTNLESLTIPESVISIGNELCSGCTSLTSAAIPSTVTSIGYSVFSRCRSLTGSITIPEGVTEIGMYLFDGCKNLTSITIPNTVTTIGQYAFYDCSGLTSIAIPDGVTSIGEKAFENCRAVRYANLDSDGAKALSKAGYSFHVPGTKYNLIYLYTDDSITGLEIGGVDKDAISVAIPNGVTSIAPEAFHQCSNLASVTIPDSVTSIGHYAFRYCTSLTSIAIPDSVTYIGNAALEYCSQLTDVTLPSNFTGEPSWLFASCSSLTHIDLPSSITSIWGRTFYNCTSLTSITIPDGVTSIGDYAFSGCSSLTSIAIPDGVTSIDDYAFSGCSNLTSITIPDSVTSIGSNVFEGCSKQLTIYIPTCNSYAYQWVKSHTTFRIVVNSHRELIVEPAEEPTCTQTGMTEGRHCTACGAVISKRETVPALGHLAVIDPAVAADCTEPGLTEGRHCERCGEVLDAQRIVPALGHNWDAPVYTWSTDNKTVTASRVCMREGCGETETETVAATGETTKQPTCTAKGETTYTSAEFQNEAFAAQSRTLANIPALGHDWGEVTYAWSADNKSVTATRTCKHDAEHVETETVAVTSKVSRQPTCTAEGETIYTSAEFQNEAFAAQSRTLDDIPAPGHEWSEVTYTWSTDNTSVTATRTCKRDAGHVETETVETVYEESKPATCSTGSQIVYTSKTFENPGFSVQTKVKTIGDALGHDWGEATYTWSADNKTVTATRACARNEEHVETETITATSQVTKQPTCTAKGKTTYTSAEFQNAAFAVQTKTLEDVPALGHDWGEATYIWAEDNSSVTGANTCKRDGTHKASETAETTSDITKEPTCTENGETTYTAVFANEALATQTKVLADIDALGHEFDEEGICEVCGYQCPHDGDVVAYCMPETISAREIEGDDENHIESRVWYRESFCDVCDAEFPREYAGFEENVVSNHHYEDGVCVDCGHVCSHSQTYTRSDWVDEEHGVQYQQVDQRYHEATGERYTETHCEYCDKLFQRTEETATVQEKHWYYENEDDETVCECCNYTNTCTHEHWVLEEDGPGDSYRDTGSDDTHVWSHLDHYVKECQDCGMIIDTEHEETVTEEPHHYTNMGVCLDCGHVKADSIARGTCGDDLVWTLDDAGTLNIGGTGAMTSHPWPAADVRNVVIGTGVTSIGDYAFYGYSKLTNVTIPGSVTSIGYCAFWDCSNLTSIAIPSSVTSIGLYAFSGCSSLTSITVPTCDCYTYEWATANVGCPVIALQHQGFDENGVCVGCGYQCPHDGDTVAYCMPETVSAREIEGDDENHIESIAWYREGSCAVCDADLSREYAGFEENVVSNHHYEDGVCVDCGHVCAHSQTCEYGEWVDEERGVQYQPFDQHYHMATGERVTGTCCKYCRAPIGEAMTDTATIQEEHFAHGYTEDEDGNRVCTNCGYVSTCDHSNYEALEAWNCGDGYQDTGSDETHVRHMFMEQPKRCLDCGIEFADEWEETILEEPHDYTNMGVCIDCGHVKVDSITRGRCGGNVVWTLDDAGTLAIGGTGAMWDNYYNGATSTAPWSAYTADIQSVIICDGVTSIGNYAFYECTGLTSIAIPEDVTSIGEMAFYGCSSLTGSITIPEGVTSIGDSAFYGCSGLTSITLPEGVTSIGVSAFGSCSGLTSIAIPSSVTSIGNYAFSGCSSLTSITIPEGVTSIGDSAFSYCNSLTGITIPEGVTSIGREAFYGCHSLTSITIPEGVTSIGVYAFEGCSGLTRMTIPSSVTSISDHAFSYCAGLTSITLPDSVTSIGLYAFYGCSSLTSVTIPSSVTSIGDYAFSDCDSLTRMTIPSSVTSIGGSAFRYCYALDKICILGETTSFGSAVFEESTPTIYCWEYSDAEGWAIDNGYTVVLLDTLTDSQREVTLPADFRLPLGETQQLDINVFPNHDNPEITWTSSDPAVVSVQDGVVTGLSCGTATITASIGTASDSVEITVYALAESFELNKQEVWLIAKESLQLFVENILPVGAEADVTWASSDETLATVSAEGLVATKKPGDVNITAASDNGIRRQCLIHLCYPVTAITFDPASLTIPEGTSAQLTANVTMRTQSCVNRLVVFSSSDETVATVDVNGVVTGVGLGTATVTATAASGVNATCEVTVRELHILNLPAGLTEIDEQAFANLPNVDAVRIPAGVTDIADDAFAGSNVVIYAPAGSYAANWAADNGFEVVEE